MAKSYGDGVTIVSRYLDDFDLKRLRLLLDEKETDIFENRLAEEDRALAQGDGFKFTAMFGDADSEYQFQYKKRNEVANFAGEFARLVHDRSVAVGAHFTLIWIPESGYRLFVIPANVMEFVIADHTRKPIFHVGFIPNNTNVVGVGCVAEKTMGEDGSIYFEQKCFDGEYGLDLVGFSAERRSNYARFNKCKVVLVPEIDSISLDEVEILKSYIDLHFSVIIISDSEIEEHVLAALVYLLADGLVTVAALRTRTIPRVHNFNLPRGALIRPIKPTYKQMIDGMLKQHKLMGLVSPDELKGSEMGSLSSVIFSGTSLVLNE